MAVGLELSNSSGKSVLSSRWHLLKFAGKGTTISHALIRNLSFPSGLVIRYYETVVESPVIPGGAYPSSFFHIPTGTDTVLCKIYSVGGGKWRALFVSFYNMIPETYWFFETIKAASGETYGMRLYSEAGELIFDTGWNASDLLKLSTIVTVPAIVGQYTDSPVGVTKPALMFCSNYWHHQQTTSIHEWFYLMGFFRGTATRFTLREIVVHYNSVSYGLSGNNYYQYDNRIIYVPIIDGSKYD